MLHSDITIHHCDSTLLQALVVVLCQLTQAIIIREGGPQLRNCPYQLRPPVSCPISIAALSSSDDERCCGCISKINSLLPKLLCSKFHHSKGNEARCDPLATECVTAVLYFATTMLFMMSQWWILTSLSCSVSNKVLLCHDSILWPSQYSLLL